MTEHIPNYAQEAYAVLYNKFNENSFPSSYLNWFVSSSMSKKTFHVLEKAGWIRRIEKGRYVCVNPDKVFKSMIEFKVPRLLEKAGRRYAYTEASAVEIWSDFSFIQRSWEHSPYYVKILQSELKDWLKYFAKHRVNVFVNSAKPALGEFVILKPEKRLRYETHNNLPVEALDKTVRYCERHIDAFEYPLAYMKAKFHVKTKAGIDKRVLEEAAMAI
jgi:hypothetical protein